MRLINLRTRKLQEVSDDELRLITPRTIFTHGPPPQVKNYAVLSHTWTHEELSFADYMCIQEEASSEKVDRLKQKAGWSKIQNFLDALTQYATNDPRIRQVEWAWVDTCCIDKSSSAELSEAINSMYRWYEESAICFAYLQDVTSAGTRLTPDTRSFASSIFNATPPRRYFTRGWTLQELIAPTELYFFNESWQYIGSKREPGTLGALSLATEIPPEILSNRSHCHQAPIAERMRWASDRRTTRPEDEAYCLMGLFDVNMPLLYGEGRKAFMRLQEAIMATQNDHTIFIWKLDQDVVPLKTPVFALARSAADFRSAPDCVGMPVLSLKRNMNFIEALFGDGSTQAPLPYQVTNTGLQIHLPVSRAPAHRCRDFAGRSMECQLALLNVVASHQTSKSDETEMAVYACIYLQRLKHNGPFTRWHPNRLVWLDAEQVLRTFNWEAIGDWCTLTTSELYLSK